MAKEIEFKIKGFKELDRLFSKLPENIAKRVVDKALIKSAKPIVKAAKANVNVRTGNLKKSIGAVKGKAKRNRRGDRTVLIGGRVGGKFKGFHAHLLEKGTKFAKPHPFLEPATASQRRRQRQIMVREFTIGIFSEVNKLALKFGTRKK